MSLQRLAQRNAPESPSSSTLASQYLPSWSISQSRLWGLVSDSIQQLDTAATPRQTRPGMPVPFGMGAVGLSSPVKAWRRRVLAVIASNRLRTRLPEEPMPTDAKPARDAAAPSCGGRALLATDASSAASPTGPQQTAMLQSRVQAVMAGASMLYTLMSFAGTTSALVHVDFSEDWVSSARTMLDFFMAAPTVHNIAGELMQIGVAVGLGVARRGQ